MCLGVWGRGRSPSCRPGSSLGFRGGRFAGFCLPGVSGCSEGGCCLQNGGKLGGVASAVEPGFECILCLFGAPRQIPTHLLPHCEEVSFILAAMMLFIGRCTRVIQGHARGMVSGHSVGEDVRFLYSHHKMVFEMEKNGRALFFLFTHQDHFPPHHSLDSSQRDYLLR